MNWLNVPKKIYFKNGSMAVALKEIDEVYNLKRAFIVSDANLYTSGAVAPVTDFVRSRGVQVAEFFTIDAEPTFANVESGLPKMQEFEPDIIIGVGGGSVMSVAKVMWLLYENPELDLNKVADKFSKIAASCDTTFPATGKKAKLILMSTTAGTGAECSPFAVLTDGQGRKRVIAGYNLLPEMAVIDADFSENMPASLAEVTGRTVLTYAVKAYTAEGASDYVAGFARDAVKTVLANLPVVLAGGPDAKVAKANMANAAALAGMAAGNSLTTIDPEAGLYPTDHDKSPSAAEKERVIDLAKHIGFTGESDAEIFDNFLTACKKLG